MGQRLHLTSPSGELLTPEGGLPLRGWGLDVPDDRPPELALRFDPKTLSRACYAALKSKPALGTATLEGQWPGGAPLRLVLRGPSVVALGDSYGAPGVKELLLAADGLEHGVSSKAAPETTPETTPVATTHVSRDTTPARPPLAEPALLRGLGRDPTPGYLRATGVDPDTGEYLLPPLHPRELAGVALGRPCADSEVLNAWLSEMLDGDEDLPLPQEDDEDARERMAVAARREEGVLGVVDGVDPCDLSEAGWGVVFVEGSPQLTELRAALAPLLQHRRQQAGARYKELTWRPGWSKADFLHANRAAYGRVDPDRLPYYLLLVGPPDQLPFSVQEQLGIQHAVGRLWFDEADAWTRYADSVVAAEERGLRRSNSLGLLGTTDDPITAHATMGLLRPLADHMRGHLGGQVTVDLRAGAEATRERLLEQLNHDALVFTATHGLGARRMRRPEQLLRQGALLTQGWRGVGEPVDPACTLSGEQLPDDLDLHGLISVHLACFGAGTPRVDRFGRALLQGRGLLPRRALVPRPLVSWLPQRMLSHPGGGALAVISHVDRSWETSFSLFSGSADGLQVDEHAHFRHLLTRLLDGQPVGAAFEDFGGWFAEKDSELRALLQAAMQGEPVDDEELALAWTAAKDAQGWVILGDPAARLVR